MSSSHNRRLIELSLPLKAISDQSAREKCIRTKRGVNLCPSPTPTAKA